MTMMHRGKINIILPHQVLISPQTVKQSTLGKALAAWAKCSLHTFAPGAHTLAAGNLTITFHFAMLTSYAGERDLGFRGS